MGKVHKVLRLPRILHFKDPQSTAHATKSAHQGPQSTAPATKCALQGPQSTAPAMISENESHVTKSRFTAPATKSEHSEDHHHVQSSAPATKSELDAPISCARHEKSTLDHQDTRFPLPRKVITKSCKTCTPPPSSTVPGQRFARSCAEKLHLEISERNFSVGLPKRRVQRAYPD